MRPLSQLSASASSLGKEQANSTVRSIGLAPFQVFLAYPFFLSHTKVKWSCSPKRETRLTAWAEATAACGGLRFCQTRVAGFSLCFEKAIFFPFSLLLL
jgi:hypothetical protein